MNLFSKNKVLRVIEVALLVGWIFFFLPFHLAQASSGACSLNPAVFSLSSCVGDVLYAVTYIISVLFGIAIALILWCIEQVLKFNLGVANTTLVQTGFSVVLSIANLGFVLGIIIVALATILRRESYGIKSILWKLVIMAILVNFALVIAVPIIGFGNNLTNYFISAFSGGSGGGITGSANGLVGGTAFQGLDNLSSGIAGIFQPQRLIAPENATGTLSSALGTANANVQAGVGAIGTIIGGVLGIGLAVVCLAMMLIALIVMFVMLLVRYVYLSVLLILAPFAWMLWIFPKTSSYFSRWWNAFIKQTFFPWQF